MKNKKNNKNIWIIGISLAVAIAIIVGVVYVTNVEYTEMTIQPRPQEIKEEVKPIEPPTIIIKQPHPIIGESKPSPLSDEYLAKWNKCLIDQTHGVLNIYPEICFTSDGLTARGPLE